MTSTIDLFPTIKIDNIELPFPYDLDHPSLISLAHGKYQNNCIPYGYASKGAINKAIVELFAQAALEVTLRTYGMNPCSNHSFSTLRSRINHLNIFLSFCHLKSPCISFFASRSVKKITKDLKKTLKIEERKLKKKREFIPSSFSNGSPENSSHKSFERGLEAEGSEKAERSEKISSFKGGTTLSIIGKNKVTPLDLSFITQTRKKESDSLKVISLGEDKEDSTEES